MEIATRESMSPAAIAELYRRGGGRSLDPSTVTRWIKFGVKVAGGLVIKLRAKRVGRSWFIDQEDFDAFINAQNPTEQVTASNDICSAVPPASSQAIAQRLDAMGAKAR